MVAMMSLRARMTGRGFGVLLAIGAMPPAALGSNETPDASGAAVSTPMPRAGAAAGLERIISVEFHSARLEDALASLATRAGVQIEPRWADDREAGLDREQLVSIHAERQAARAVLERILEAAGAENTWQVGAGGAVEVGPKSRLNRTRRTEVLDVSDLLLVVPDYTDAPSIDLQQAIRAGTSGGGPALREEPDRKVHIPSKAERLADLIALVTTLVEPDGWVTRGGDAATIRGVGGQIIVTAPGYVLRQIGAGR